jgi:uroporphyrinogen decarboxylase
MKDYPDWNTVSADEAKNWFSKKFCSPEKAAYSSRDRVIRALNNKAPDRVPFDFWAVPETWNSLKDFLKINDNNELMETLGIDCRVVKPNYIGPDPEILDDGSFYNIWGSVRKIVTNGSSSYEEYAAYPLAEFNTPAEVEQWNKWPTSSCWDWNSFRIKVEKANKKIPCHIRYDIGGIFESAWGLYGLDRFLMGFYENPELVCSIMECYTDIFISNFRALMDKAEDLVDMVYTYDDIATQDGLMISPDMWRQYILPFHQKLNKVIREYDVKLMYHSCGAVRPLIPAFIEELDIDVLNPLQPRAKGMDMAFIKKTYGDRLSFHGGVDLQKTLPFGTVEDVQAEVSNICHTLGQGGGYICTSAHYIQGDVPVRNILALYGQDRMF